MPSTQGSSSSQTGAGKQEPSQGPPATGASASSSVDPPEITQADGTYLHTERRMVAYSLSQNSWEPLTEPSPPLKRLALGARVIHEWGHLCEESGWLGVPEARATGAAS